jgi:hypothetical protein
MLFAKLSLAVAGLLAAFLLLLAPSLSTTAGADQPAATLAQTDKKTEAKVKWEYKALTSSDIEKLAPKGSQDKFTDGLDSLGDQGWELVAIAPSQPEPGGLGGLGGPGAGRAPMPGGPGGPGMLGPPGMKPNTFVFKRPK